MLSVMRMTCSPISGILSNRNNPGEQQSGSELAIVVIEIGDKKADFYVMLSVAAFAMWNMGVAFLVGVILDNSLRKGWLKI